MTHDLKLLEERYCVLDHIDITLICDHPKLSDHREAMRSRLAALLDLPRTAVSLKATTTEGLGFTGRGEGIAAQAVATIRLPLSNGPDAPI